MGRQHTGRPLAAPPSLDASSRCNIGLVRGQIRQASQSNRQYHQLDCQLEGLLIVGATATGCLKFMDTANVASPTSLDAVGFCFCS
ncbi:hypothetical protein WJX77_007145 [Trebouxia sp. C0004]